MSDTPRTDKVANAAHASQFEYSRAMTGLARELERELNQAIVKLGKLAATKSLVVNVEGSKKFKPSVVPVNPYDKFTNDEVVEKLRRYKAPMLRAVSE